MHDHVILAIESSCDETSAAVIVDGRRIMANVIASSTAMHQKYGGIVPEVAAREQLKSIIPVLTEALAPLSDPADATPAATIRRCVDAVAVTYGPGLIGSLLIGIEAAKTVAMLSGKPLIPVNHVLAHMYANFLDVPGGIGGNDIQFPAVSLVVSGGHTELLYMQDDHTLTWLGGTIDDAAGEAFDKTARLLGFGSRGGLAIQEAATRATTQHDVTLPRPLMHDGTFGFSFSGLKTAVMREWNRDPLHDDAGIAAFAREVQEAITDVLVAKTVRAATEHGARSVLVSGGVSANARLREKLSSRLGAGGIRLHAPPVALCTDNAAYIGSYAYFRGQSAPWESVAAVPDLSVEVTS